MITVGDIYDFLDAKAPFSSAEEWDNPGLLVGDRERKVTQVLVCLDITRQAVETAAEVGAELVVSHHPVIFSPLKRLLADTVPYQLARAGLSAICAHTNLDKAAGGVNDWLAARLGFQQVMTAEDGLCRLATLPEPWDGRRLAETAACCLHTPVRCRPGTAPITRVLLCGGAGGEELLPLCRQADAVITGELKHHEWLAFPEELTLIDAGHYATEICMVEGMAAWLREAFPTLEVLPSTGTAPYETVGKPVDSHA